MSDAQHTDLKQEASGGIQSLDAALRVLQHLATLPGAVGVSELARACDMPVSKVHRYLASFVHAGLVQQNGRSGTYDLGLAAQSLGLAALARRDIVNTVSDELIELTRETGCTTLLSVWADLGPTVVRWQRAPAPVITSFGLGTTFPLLSSATGRAFFAFSPPELVAAHIAQEKRRAGQNPLLVEDLPEAGSMDQRIAILREKTRAARVAIVDGRFIPGLRACAAPILNWQGEADVVVTAIGTDPALSDAESDTVRRLIKFAERLSSV
jgi:DNA-binding IclR family transcriptional regulator